MVAEEATAEAVPTVAAVAGPMEEAVLHAERQALPGLLAPGPMAQMQGRALTVIAPLQALRPEARGPRVLAQRLALTRTVSGIRLPAEREMAVRRRRKRKRGPLAAREVDGRSLAGAGQ